MLVAKRKTGLTSGPQRQRGVAIVIVTIGMVAMLAMAGLALDMGDVYMNKTRLQNGLDAAALSAAKELVIHPGDTVAATIKARDTFVANQDEGNERLLSIGYTDVQTEFSDTLVPWVPNSGTNFVRVWVDTFTLSSFLISVLGIDDKPVGASATAGPAKATCPNIFPLMACGNPDPDDGGGPPHYGYTPGNEVILKTHAGPCPEPPTPENPDPCNGPGNFQVLDVGSGASAVRAAICGIGEYDCPEGEVYTEPGNMVGPVGQAVNAYFGIHHGPVDPSTCPADDNTAAYGPGGGPYYNPDYIMGFGDPEGEPGNHRRVVPIPVGACSEDSGGKKIFTIDTTLCFLLTRPAETTGNTQLVFGEFLGAPGDPTFQSCLAEGALSPDPDPDAGAPVIIVLFKDQIQEES